MTYLKNKMLHYKPQKKVILDPKVEELKKYISLEKRIKLYYKNVRI